MGLGHWHWLVSSGTSFFFIEQLLSSLLNSYLVISVAVSFLLNQSLLFQNFLKLLGEWGGAREGQAPRTMYMHICICKNEILTTLERNINQLIFY